MLWIYCAMFLETFWGGISDDMFDILYRVSRHIKCFQLFPIWKALVRACPVLILFRQLLSLGRCIDISGWCVYDNVVTNLDHSMFHYFSRLNDYGLLSHIIFLDLSQYWGTFSGIECIIYILELIEQFIFCHSLHSMQLIIDKLIKSTSGGWKSKYNSQLIFILFNNR